VNIRCTAFLTALQKMTFVIVTSTLFRYWCFYHSLIIAGTFR